MVMRCAALPRRGEKYFFIRGHPMEAGQPEDMAPPTSSRQPLTGHAAGKDGFRVHKGSCLRTYARSRVRPSGDRHRALNALVLPCELDSSLDVETNRSYQSVALHHVMPVQFSALDHTTRSPCTFSASCPFKSSPAFSSYRVGFCSLWNLEGLGIFIYYYYYISLACPIIHYSYLLPCMAFPV